MATGITGKEKLSADALLATRNDDFAMNLPGPEAVVQLTYAGKISEEKILKPIDHDYFVSKGNSFVEAESIGPDSFILADNFYALHALLAAKQKVSLIYLDPPYGTGMDFQSRQLEHAYKDNMSPARYIEFLRRRLILMRELLTDEGSIYLQIGHQMVSHLKVLMDEVFGVENFRNLITRRKCSSKNFTRNQYSNLNDYILFYSKTQNYTWNKPGIKPDEEWIDKEYPKTDQKGRFKLVPVHAPGTRKGETGKTWKGLNPPPGKHWQFRPSKLDEFDAAGEIHWSKNGNPRRKVYLTSETSLAVSDYWEKFRDAHHQSIEITGYPTEKNFEMLKLIVGASSKEGDTVLDPFCGSGTSLQAARDLKRKWIGIDESFVAAKTTLKRMSRGTAPMGDYVKSKTGTKQASFKMESNSEKSPFKFLVDESVLMKYGDELKNLID